MAFLLGINLYIYLILSSSRHNISSSVSIWFNWNVVHMSPVPLYHSDSSMRRIQWTNIFSCSKLVIVGMILDVVNIKYV